MVRAHVQSVCGLLREDVPPPGVTLMHGCAAKIMGGVFVFSPVRSVETRVARLPAKVPAEMPAMLFLVSDFRFVDEFCTGNR